ncbi:probable high-affinity glucose transporter RGT2 [Rhynchosporium secalis]|uniref:Probable high-affinity glucose transporter RGT2 n=1 Tax=Rhynchosporium secalis TaxID=38038 RepID=A0A1E1MIV2_RHYSE|nr:probable high-affinity glucose transporter RGT2 [Rhynchosporium secalis]
MGEPAFVGTADTDRVEAPVTWKSYMMCVFAAFGGVFFGYDSGYISGVLAMDYFINMLTGKPIPGVGASAAELAAFVIPTSHKTLIVSILSAGTFFGAIIAGDSADWIGRRLTVIAGCFIYGIGCILQTIATSLGLLVAGRLIAGFGVGFVSAIIILYMSEIAPKKVRGAIVSGYQFAITIGLLLASCVDYATQDRTDSGSYRIPVGLQLAWALVLAGGLFWLPESPRFFVMKGRLDDAARVLERLRDQPAGSELVQAELTEIIANYEYEMSVIPQDGYFSSWANCFKGGLSNPASNLRRTILGTSIQMMQQWTGVNFIFYYGTTFFTSLGTIKNPFFISLITTLVNVCSTPLSFYIIERLGRRTIMIWGAIGMVICQFIVAIIGVSTDTTASVQAQIAFICIYISFFATTWGPGAWVVIGEIFPIPIRSRGVALSAASNWLWNCIIAIITPYLTSTDGGGVDLGSRIFFLWGSLCFLCVVYAYVLIPETKGLTLEQVDRMLEETTPRTSAKWVPHSTYAAEMGMTDKKRETAKHVEKGTIVDQSSEKSAV